MNTSLQVGEMEEVGESIAVLDFQDGMKFSWKMCPKSGEHSITFSDRLTTHARLKSTEMQGLQNALHASFFWGWGGGGREARGERGDDERVLYEWYDWDKHSKHCWKIEVLARDDGGAEVWKET